MSTIGDPIQNSLVNANIAIKEQQAGQIAQADEDAKRQGRIRREEELARESVRKSHDASQERVFDTPPREEREPPARSRRSDEKPEAQAEDDDNDDGNDKDSGHIDLFV